METTYNLVTPPPPSPPSPPPHRDATRAASPGKPAISASPAQLRPGESSTVSGSGWTPGSKVVLSLNGAGKQEDVGSANVDRAGKVSVRFTLSPEWNNAGPVQLVARSSDGLVATVGLVVLPVGGGDNLEYGLDMSVQRYQGFGDPYIKLTGVGWRPGLALTISVVSSEGDLNLDVATAAVRAAASQPLPPSGLYLQPVPAEALLDYGINLAITPKPKCWISASEIARYKALRGK